MAELKQVPVEEVAVVAEMTTPSGPLIDDHLLVCVLRDGTVREIPLAAVIGSPWADELERRCGKLDLKLGNSTAFRTRIIYPPSLHEHQLMIEKPRRRNLRSFLRRLRLFGMDEIETVLSPEVVHYLGIKPVKPTGWVKPTGSSQRGQANNC